MQDRITKHTGNSRYLKSVENFLSLYPTYESFAQALIAGTLPIDLNGINADGWVQQGTPLNKASLLKDTTAALYGLGSDAVPDDVLKAVDKELDNVDTKLANVEKEVDNKLTEIEKDVDEKIAQVEEDIDGKLTGLEEDVEALEKKTLTGQAVTATSTDGSAYYVTIPELELSPANPPIGMQLIIIPSRTSDSTTPALYINGVNWGAIHRYQSTSSDVRSGGYSRTWLAANYPVRLMFDGYNWKTGDLTRPMVADLDERVTRIVWGTHLGTNVRPSLADPVTITTGWRPRAAMWYVYAPATFHDINGLLVPIFMTLPDENAESLGIDQNQIWIRNGQETQAPYSGSVTVYMKATSTSLQIWDNTADTGEYSPVNSGNKYGYVIFG